MEEESKGKNIFLVEDNVFLSKVLANKLTKNGFNVTAIDAGDKALDIIRNKVPDLLLLDIFIPGINGLDLLEILRKEDATKELKVFMISNTDQADSRKKAKELGASFIVKAISTPEEITETVKEALGL